MDIIRTFYYIHGPWVDEINFAVLCVSWTMGLIRCYKTEGFFTFIFAVILPYFMLWLSVTLVEEGWNRFAYHISMTYHNPQLRQNYFRFGKTDGGHIGMIVPVSILTYMSSSHAILHLPAKFRSKRIIGGGVIMSYRRFNMAAIEWEIYFWVQV